MSDIQFVDITAFKDTMCQFIVASLLHIKSTDYQFLSSLFRCQHSLLWNTVPLHILQLSTHFSLLLSFSFTVIVYFCIPFCTGYLQLSGCRCACVSICVVCMRVCMCMRQHSQVARALAKGSRLLRECMRARACVCVFMVSK